MRITERVRNIAPSLTVVVLQKAMRLRAAGVDVISFGTGEPDFDTPAHIKEAATAALGRGASKYTPVAGLPELRRAIADETNRAHGTQFGPEEVIVTCGAKHALHNLFMALVEDGDEVVIPSPCWASYPEMVTLAGGRPRLLPAHAADGWRIDARALAEVVHPRTRAIVLCSPCNPTGGVYDAETLAAVARVVRERGGPDTLIVADDIYRDLVYRGPWCSIAQVAPELRDRILLVDGVSKSYAMTGWRIGWMAGPRELVQAMVVLQGQQITSATTVAQAAALAALSGPREPVESMRVEFDRRRRVMLERVRALPDVKLTMEPEGAFYLFPDFSAYTHRAGLAGDVQLAEWLLERARVAVVPGSGFFAPGYLRLSYATSMAAIVEGLGRIGAALAELSRKGAD